MAVIDIYLDGDGAFRDLQDKYGDPIVFGEDAPGLEHGMTSGKPSVAIAFLLPDNRWFFAETSLRLFLTTADALKARFGDPRG